MSQRPTPTPGRRRAEARPPKQPAGKPRLALVAAPVLVVLLAAALWCAGTAPRAGGLHGGTQETSSLSRSVSCVGGPAGAKVVVGRTTGGSTGVSVDNHPAKPGPVKLGTTPTRVVAARSAAATSYAVQSASGQGWLAAAPCAAPQSESWLLGAGGVTAHHGVLTLDNPRAGDAVVNVDVFGPAGPVKVSGLHGLRVPAGQSLRLPLQKVASANGDLAVHVTALRGLVAANVADQWSASVASSEIGEWLPAQGTAQRRLTLDGLDDGDSTATLLVANPAAKTALVHLRLVGGNGSYAPAPDKTYRVAPHTLHPIDLSGLLRSHPSGIVVRSQLPVAATLRNVDRVDEAEVAPAQSFGSSGVAPLPPGTTGRLSLVAPSRAGKATVTGYAKSGRVLGRRTVPVKAHASAQLKLWPGTRSVAVKAPAPGSLLGTVLVQGASSTTAAIPVRSAGLSSDVPLVRPGW